MSNITEIRNVPVQHRSAARLAALETAARNVINEVGRDAFTTAQVAERAGVSIGTVYRYFVNKIAILDHVWPNRDAHLPDGFELTADAMTESAPATEVAA